MYSRYSSGAKFRSISSLIWYTSQDIVLTNNFYVPRISSSGPTIELRVIPFRKIFLYIFTEFSVPGPWRLFNIRYRFYNHLGYNLLSKSVRIIQWKIIFLHFRMYPVFLAGNATPIILILRIFTNYCPNGITQLLSHLSSLFIVTYINYIYYELNEFLCSFDVFIIPPSFKFVNTFIYFFNYFYYITHYFCINFIIFSYISYFSDFSFYFFTRGIP